MKKQKNSVINRIEDADREFHDWYRFVLSYPPHIVRQYLEEFNLSQDDIVLDPFCGTGTTIVECKLQNINSIGVEANPFAHFASSVKVDWDIDSQSLIKVAGRIKDSCLEALIVSGVSDDMSQENISAGDLLSLNPEQIKLLLKDSISPLPLHKCLVLLNEINKCNELKFKNIFQLALANAAVYSFSNLKFGPEVGVSKIKTDARVISVWYTNVIKMANDLSRHNHNDTSAYAILNDSRNIKDALGGKMVSAVITSPPYPNEKDYTRTTRLESVLLGFISTKSDLKKFKKTLLRSNTRGVYKEDNDDQYVKSFPEIQRIANDIEKRRLELGKTSGFEKLYHRVTKLYFGGIAKHLIELQSVLKPNAHLAYVVGDQASYLRIMIRTGELIAEIAQSLGYELVRIDLFRTRFSTATKSDLREEVVILRWPG